MQLVTAEKFLNLFLTKLKTFGQVAELVRRNQ